MGSHGRNGFGKKSRVGQAVPDNRPECTPGTSGFQDGCGFVPLSHSGRPWGDCSLKRRQNRDFLLLLGFRGFHEKRVMSCPSIRKNQNS